MIKTLELRKKSNKVWLNKANDQPESIISKFYVTVDGLEFQVVEQGQARRNKYLLGNITVYDDTSGGVAETFSTITALMLRLEALKYPAFFNEGESLIDAFTDLTDTPSDYLGQAGKAVKVKTDESGLEFGDPSGFNFQVNKKGETPIANVNQIEFEGATVSNESGGKVKVTITGGSGSQDLQSVRNENPNVTVENPNDENNTGTWLSLQYLEEDLEVSERVIINRVVGDIDYSSIRTQKAQVLEFYGNKFNTVTENSSYSIVGVANGKVVMQEIIDDATLNQGSHKIELDPAIGVNVVFKTPSDETAGTKSLATREWVNANKANVEEVIRSKANDTFGSHTGDTLETVLLAIDIDANEFVAGDRLIYKIFTDKSAAVGNVQFRVRVGTTGTTSDSLIATSANFTGNNARYMMFDRQRNFFLSGNSFRCPSASVASATDINAMNGAPTTVSLNPSNAWKFVITAQLSAIAETTNLLGYTISKIKSL
jgi:hypothetical protein